MVREVRSVMSEAPPERRAGVLARVEWLFPLRGRWLAYFLAGVLLLTWGVCRHLRLHFRAYLANSPDRPYNWNPAPTEGLDCKGRMDSSHSGEIARSLRVGDVVVEVSQGFDMGSDRLLLDGPDCD